MLQSRVKFFSILNVSFYFLIPDVVWCKNDKLIMNTENVKVRIFEEEKRTTLTIKRSTREDDATYVCKATSDIGMTITKAKLHVDTISEVGPKPDEVVEEEEVVEVKPKRQEEKPHKKKKPEIKKAKEIKEKVKAERVKVKTEEIHEEKLVPKEQTEKKSVILHFVQTPPLNLLHSQIVILAVCIFFFRRIVDVEETQLLETTEIIKEDKSEEVLRICNFYAIVFIPRDFT